MNTKKNLSINIKPKNTKSLFQNNPFYFFFKFLMVEITNYGIDELFIVLH